MKTPLLLLFFIITTLSFAQETVGLVYDNTNREKSEGYTLFTALNDDRTFLINNCGEVVNEWTSTWGNAPNQKSRMVYLLENGNIMIGSGLDVEIRDWDNNKIWGINYQQKLGFRIHHDIEPLPNGNFLVLVRDSRTSTEMFAAGMDTSYPEDTYVLERIVEIKPIGTDDASIVWEWKLFDHLVQEFDNTKPNYGQVSSNPQLLDMNYDAGHGSNPIHANAVEYNAELDQIAVSARHLSEVFIIDHSTTTEEAATHTGGNSNKGGDLLWRWGNPEVFDKGTADDRKLGEQHDIKWIEEGPHKDKLSVFSNYGYGSDHEASSIHILTPVFTNGAYAMNAGKFLPADYTWSYDGTIMGEVVYEPSRSGVQIMSNGNALINETGKGRISEVDANGNLVWVYIIPTASNSTFDQFEDPIGNEAFRAHRYATDFSGFDNVTFVNQGIIENENTISQNCSESLSVTNFELSSVNIYPNPVSDIINIHALDKIDLLELYDLSGKLLIKRKDANSLDLNAFSNGIYLLKISANNTSQIHKIIKN